MGPPTLTSSLGLTRTTGSVTASKEAPELMESMDASLSRLRQQKQRFPQETNIK